MEHHPAPIWRNTQGFLMFRRELSIISRVSGVCFDVPAVLHYEDIKCCFLRMKLQQRLSEGWIYWGVELSVAAGPL